MYGRMQLVWANPDSFTFTCVLKACSGLPALEMGRQVHALSVKIGLISDVFVGCGAFDMYSKTGSIADAGKLFDEMPERNIVTWNAYISNAVLDGRPKGALQAFIEFVRKLGIEPTDYVISSVVSACAELAGMELGRSVHALAVKSCVDADVYVGSALVDMYGKCGSIHDAEQTFREMPEKNLFAWNAMISGYAHQGHADMAIRLFRKLFDEMPERNIVTWNAYISNAVLDGRPKGALQAFIEFVWMGGEPDGITLCAFLNACADTLNLVLGKQLHGFVMRSGFEMMRSGFESDVSVSNGLIDFYGKCKEVGLAEMVFDGMERRNLSVVTWTSLISGCVQNGHFSSALRLFSNMRREDILPKPTDYVISSVVSACAELAGIELGRSVHALAVNSCVDADVYVGSALVDMYGKCGSIHDAEQTFREMPEKNLFAWNAMISGYAHQGHADMAIGLFREMASVVAPNYVTFVCVLSACSRGGAVETGMDVYESMMKKYGIEAGPEHYACVVDMLARSGLVERAYDFVQKLPIRPTISIWGALLNACRVHGKPEIGKIAADNLFELDPKDSGNHVLLSNMFAVAGR
ncbi:Pentatricopeptide repeat-containing protein At4g14850 [Linum perenne]